ncbi:MAG: ABC transporter permease [candidate division FCPU426 bacterium]
MNFISRDSRTLSIARKEFRHIARDPFTLGMALGLPLLLLVFFGFAIDFDVRDIHLTVFDRDNTRISRQFVDSIRGTGLFIIKPGVGGVNDDLDHERVKGTLVIEKGFGEDLRGGKSPKAQLLMDGADNSGAGVIASYLGGLVPAAWIRLKGLEAARMPIQLKTRFLFNGELNSRWFIIPGLAVLIMGLLATLLTATTVAREWEHGSMELLLSTPVKPIEIILGKLLPYLCLGLGAVLLIYVSARLVFGLPFAGSHLLYLVGCLLFLIPCLALGLIISSVARQQQVAMQMSMMITMLPSMLLSGFIFPVESMPAFFYYITAIIPARWFIVVSRGLYLKGEGIVELALPLGILLVMNVFFVRLALKKFKADLEP